MKSDSAELLFPLGVILIFLGAFVVLLGLFPIERAEGVGVVIIGPFPIIFQGEVSPFIFLIMTLLLILFFIIVILGITRKFIERQLRSEEV